MKVMLDEGAFKPVWAHDIDAGLDLLSPVSIMIPAHGSAVIDTGVHIELPHGTVGILFSKSGLNVKHDITSTGVVDEGYTGSICVKLYNHGENSYQVNAKDKISQLVILPCLYESVEIAGSISGGERGASGFGSTGR